MFSAAAVLLNVLDSQGSGSVSQRNGTQSLRRMSRPRKISRASAARRAISASVFRLTSNAASESTSRAAISDMRNGSPPVIILWAVETRFEKFGGQATHPARSPAPTAFESPPT